MKNMRLGGGTAGILGAGIMAVGLAMLPLAGCSHLAGSAEESGAQATTDSSMTVQGGARTAAPAPSDVQLASAGTESGASAVAVAAGPASSGGAAIPAIATAPALTPEPSQSPGEATPKVAILEKPVLKGLDGSGLGSEARKLNPAMIHALKEFQTASAQFPNFCREWEHKLVVREHDNLNHIKWVMHDGVETGSYVGYGAIESCTCKQSGNGVSVGILTYKEYDYTLTGKSVAEAKHASPHADAVVPTREIFAYEKGKWFW
jgi:hypothetical protein